MAKIKQYHFSLGDSSKGPVGFCALIKTHSKKKAIEILKRVIPQELAIPYVTDDAEDSVVYLTAYFNENAITEKDIDEVEEAIDA